jgi:hypothetical protein
MTVGLVAMSRGGDTFVVRRADGSLWLHVPEGGAGAGPIDHDGVDRAVVDHGFVVVNEEFEAWPKVVARVRELSAPATLTLQAITHADVVRYLPTLREDAADSALRVRVIDEALSYLKVPGVYDDAELTRALHDIIEAAHRLAGGSPGSVLPRTNNGSTFAEAQAHQRWADVQRIGSPITQAA